MNWMGYKRAMDKICASEEEILMKAKEMQTQFEMQNAAPVRHHAKRGLLTGIAAAAAMLICGTVTVGAVNNWDYAAVFNRYFTKQTGEEIAYDFTGMGLDIADTYTNDAYTVELGSVIADTNSLCLSYRFRLAPEYAAQLPQTGEQLYGSLLLRCGVKDAAGNLIDSKTAFARDAAQNADGSFDMVLHVSLDGCTDFSDKTLELQMNEIAYVATHEADARETVLETAKPVSSTYRTYSLAGVTAAQGITVQNVALTDGGYTADYDTVTVSPLRVTFRCTDLPITPPESTEPGVKLGGGTYGFTFTGDDAEEPEDAAAWENAHITGNPVPADYRNVKLRSLSLIYSDGTERAVDLNAAFSLAMGRTKDSDTGVNDLMDLEAMVDYPAPLPLEGLTAIRVNGKEIPVQ